MEDKGGIEIQSEWVMEKEKAKKKNENKKQMNLNSAKIFFLNSSIVYWFFSIKSHLLTTIMIAFFASKA